MIRFRHERKRLWGRGMTRRGLALLLSLSTTLSLFINTALLPVSAAEVYAGGPCEHHAEADHAAELCGYVEASPCGFVCEDCAGAVEDYESGPCEHHAGHTEDCGYSEGSPCAFMCEICSAPDGGDAEPDPEPGEQPPQDEGQTGGQPGNTPQPTPGIVELPQSGIQSGDPLPWDVVFPENDPRFSEEDKAWIVEELRRIESLYNNISMGVAPAAFLEEKGVIPWDTFDAVTNINSDEINDAFKSSGMKPWRIFGIQTAIRWTSTASRSINSPHSDESEPRHTP